VENKKAAKATFMGQSPSTVFRDLAKWILNCQGKLIGAELPCCL
jgi:hypothetical protein